MELREQFRRCSLPLRGFWSITFLPRWKNYSTMEKGKKWFVENRTGKKFCPSLDVVSFCTSVSFFPLFDDALLRYFSLNKRMDKQLNNFIVITGSPLLVISTDWSLGILWLNLFGEMFSSGSKIFNRIKSWQGGKRGFLSLNKIFSSINNHTFVWKGTILN